jgi:hypothetical protein
MKATVYLFKTNKTTINQAANLIAHTVCSGMWIDHRPLGDRDVANKDVANEAGPVSDVVLAGPVSDVVLAGPVSDVVLAGLVPDAIKV